MESVRKRSINRMRNVAHPDFWSKVVRLAQQMHSDYRAAFKTLHVGRNRLGHIGAPKNCIHEHDHGWTNCHRQDYFIRRARMVLIAQAAHICNGKDCPECLKLNF